MAPQPAPAPAPEAPSEAPSEALPEALPEAPVELAASTPVVAPPSQAAVLAPAEVNLEALVPATPARITPEMPPPPETLAYVSKPPIPAPTSMIFPLAAEAPVTSPFGWRTHPISGSRRFHAGTDFGAPQGTPVLAALSGRIKLADWNGGYGLAVQIEHNDGTLDTFYAHLSEVMVQAGDLVERGTVVGHVGTTGYSTGPHLHFEVRRKTDGGWVEVDPMAEIETQPQAEQPAPAEPEAPVAQVPEEKPEVVPAPSAQPTPEYSLSQVPDLKGAMTSAVNATSNQDLPAPSTTLTAAASASAQPESAETPQESSQEQVSTPEVKDLNYWSDLCQSLVSKGQFSEALAACDRTLTLQPDALEIWVHRGQALEGLGLQTEALASYSYVLHRQPRHSQSLTYQCRTFLKMGSLEAALEACDQALSAARSWGQASPADAWHLRGQVLAQQTHHEEALRAYARALRVQDKRSDVLVDRCRSLLALGRYEDGLAACEEATAINQNWGKVTSAQVQHLQGRALAQLGRGEAAIAAFDQARAQDPKNADLWADQGQVLQSLGRYDDALNAFQQAAQIKPDSSRVLMGQAAALNHLQRHEPALEAIDRALQGDGVWGSFTPSQIWDQQAQALGGVGRYDEGLAAANRAIELQPDSAAALNNRAVILWHLEQPEEALASTQKAIKLDPSYAPAWFNQGRLLSTTGEHAQALAAYDEVLRLNLDLATASLWINRAGALWSLGRLNDSLADLDKAIRLDPSSTEAQVNRGIVLLRMGRFEDAIAAYDKAIELDPNATAARYGRGTALMRLNRASEASEAFAKIDF
ncbi:MAG: tetratricopeptide repeat protein [Cyanobacteria bacterium Co-bin8]|nr:tetratricopeptide repeat protein [Cyanobacteria bacterium Co-bin8]